MNLPPITDEDRQFLHYNPNTNDIVEWVQRYATAAVEAERQRRDGEDFEDALEAHHRAELGLRPKLPKGHHYYVAHPLAQVEIRKDSAITEDRAALAPLGAQAVPISILELMDEVRGLAAQWAGDEVDLACAPSEDASARAQNSHDVFNAAIARLASMSTGTTSPAQIAEDRAALAGALTVARLHVANALTHAQTADAEELTKADLYKINAALSSLAASPPPSAALADELDDLDRALIEKCKKGVEYLDNGDPLKDVLDQDDIEEAVQLLVRLAAAPKQAAPAAQVTQEDLRRLVHYVAQMGSGCFSDATADAVISKALGTKGKP